MAAEEGSGGRDRRGKAAGRDEPARRSFLLLAKRERLLLSGDGADGDHEAGVLLDDLDQAGRTVEVRQRDAVLVGLAVLGASAQLDLAGLGSDLDRVVGRVVDVAD